MMRLTVIIPVYNREATIARTLRSLPDRSQIAYEIIVSDDGSTDESVRVVESLGLSHLRIVRSATRRNGNAARNSGIRAATGEILAFLDSDDEFGLSRVSGLVSYFQANPEVDVVMSNFTTELHGTLRQFRFKETTLSQEQLRDALVCHAIPITFSSIAVRRSLFNAMGGLDDRIERHQDRDFLLSVLSSRRTLRVCNSSDVVKHQSHDSFSRSGIGYMRALDVLVSKHNLFCSGPYERVMEYLVVRSLLHSLTALRLTEFASNFWNSPALNKRHGLALWSYVAGKRLRRKMERALTEPC